MWIWTEVTEWAGLGHDWETGVVIQAVNGALALRRSGRLLTDEDRRRLVGVATAG